jgi:hypothetical protein
MVAYCDCRIAGFLSHFDAWSATAGRKGGLTPPIREERVIQEHKKTTNEASMSLKTQEGHRKTKLKRTNFEPPVCISDPKSEPSSATGVRAAGRSQRNAPRTEIDPRGET